MSSNPNDSAEQRGAAGLQVVSNIGIHCLVNITVCQGLQHEPVSRTRFKNMLRKPCLDECFWVRFVEASSRYYSPNWLQER